MNKKNNKKNQQTSPKDGIEGRLEALAALTVGVLRTVAKDPKSKQVQVSGAEDKAVVAMVSAGMTQLEVAKLLGIDMNRVNKICKSLKK